MNQAFSIPELVTIIVIIGILATLGLQQYRSFVANGRQAEAKLNLRAIGDLQDSYKYEKGKYHDLPEAKGVGAFASDQCGDTNGEQMKNELGFRPSSCKKLRYGYWWIAGSTNEAYAKSTKKKLIYPGCKKIDKWTLTLKTKEIEQKDKVNDDVIHQCE